MNRIVISEKHRHLPRDKSKQVNENGVTTHFIPPSDKQMHPFFYGAECTEIHIDHIPTKEQLLYMITRVRHTFDTPPKGEPTDWPVSIWLNRGGLHVAIGNNIWSDHSGDDLREYLDKAIKDNQ